MMRTLQVGKRVLFMSMALCTGLLVGCAHHGHGPYSKMAKATISGCTDPNISGTGNSERAGIA